MSNSRGDDIRKFSLVLVLTLAPKGFSSDTPVFPFAQKTIISKSFILSGSGMVNEFEPLCKCATPKLLYTNYKLICNLIKHLFEPYSDGVFSSLSVTRTRELRSPPRLSKKSFVWLNNDARKTFHTWLTPVLAPRAKNESLRLEQSEKGIKWSLTSNLKRTETSLSVEIRAIAKAILYNKRCSRGHGILWICVTIRET